MSCKQPKSSWTLPYGNTNNDERVRYEGSCGTFGEVNNEWSGCKDNDKMCGCYNMTNEEVCAGTFSPCKTIKRCAIENHCTDQTTPTNCPDGYVCCGRSTGAVGDSSGGSLGRCGKSCNYCGPKFITIPAEEGSFKEMGVRVYKKNGCGGDYIEFIPSIPESVVPNPTIPARGVSFYTAGQVIVGDMLDNEPQWTYPSFIIRASSSNYLYQRGQSSANVSKTDNSHILQLTDTELIGSFLNNMGSLYVPPHLEVDFIMNKPGGCGTDTNQVYRFSDFPSDPDAIKSVIWEHSLYNPNNRCSIDKIQEYLTLLPNKDYIRAEILGETAFNAKNGDGAIGCICPTGVLYAVQPDKIIGIVVRVRGTPTYTISQSTGRMIPVANDRWRADSFSDRFITNWLGTTTRLIEEPQPLLIMSPGDYEKSTNIAIMPNLAWAMLLYTSAMKIQNEKDPQLIRMMRGFRTVDNTGKILASPSDSFMYAYANRQLSLSNIAGSPNRPSQSPFMPGSDPTVSCFAGSTTGGLINTPSLPQCTIQSCINAGYKTPTMLETRCEDVSFNSCANIIVQDIVGTGKNLRVNNDGQIIDSEGNLVSNVVLSNNCVQTAKEAYDYDPRTGNVGEPDAPVLPDDPYKPSTNTKKTNLIWLILFIVIIVITGIIIIIYILYRRKRKSNT